MTNKGLAIKTVIIGAALAACITGVWVVSTKDTKAEGKVVTDTAEEKRTAEYDIISPVHFGRTKPAWSKYEGIEVTSFDEAINDAGNAGSETAEGTVDESGSTDAIGIVGDTEGDSAPVEGSEPEYAADEYIVPEQEIPVEEPAEEIPAPEESTIVEEPAPEPEPVVEEPVAEPEPVAEEPSMEYLGDWTISFYCNCYQCCGQWSGGATASGAMPTPWYTVATGDLPFGTILHIDGLGTFEVQDRGTGYGWADVFVSDHGEALANGLQYRSVWRAMS